jgi:hypothetical protein
MERRAKEKGITLPAHGSSQGGMGGMAMNGMGGMHGMHGMGMGMGMGMDDAAHGGAGHRH